MKKHVLAAFMIGSVMTAKAQWIPQNAGFVNDTLGFYELSYASKDIVWTSCFDIKAFVNGGRFILDFTRTTNGGETWIPGKVGVGNEQGLQIANITAISKEEAWVALNKRYLTGGGLYQTIDAGLTWQKSNADNIFDENSYPNFVHFKDKNKGIAQGDPNNGYFEVYTTMNGGKKWKRVPESALPAPLPNEYGWLSGFAALDNTIWFGTLSGRMYKTTDFGNTWNVYDVDRNKAVFEIAFSDDKMHGVSHLRDNFGTYLYTTDDGGVTWVNRGQPEGWKSSRITAVPGTSAFVATSVSFFDRGSSVSYDHGITWNIIENAVPKTVTRYFDKETGFTGAPFVYGPPLRGGIWKSAIDFSSAVVNRREENYVQSFNPAIEVPAEKQVSVYPSPANNIIHVVLPEQVEKTKSFISLLNPNGQVVESKRSLGQKQVSFNVSNLSPGMYVVSILANNQTINKTVTVIR